MNVPNPAGYAGMIVQCTCNHCGEMYASNYIHTCDGSLAQQAQRAPFPLLQQLQQQQSSRIPGEPKGCPICRSGTGVPHGCISG